MAASYHLILASIDLAFGIFIFLLSLTILRIGGSGKITRSTALMLFFCGLGPILTATNIILLGSLREGSIVYTSMVDNFEYLWEFYFPSLFLFSLTFPKENRFIRNHSFLAILIFLPHIAHLITIMLADASSHFVTDIYKNLTSYTELPGEKGRLAFAGFGNLLSIAASLLVRLHRQLFSLVNIVFAVMAFVFLAGNRRSLLNPRTARQMKTILYGLSISIVMYAATKIAPAIIGRGLPEDIKVALINLSLVAGGGTVGYAVVRQSFLGIRFVMRKSVLYGGVSMFFALLYLVVVKPVSTFFGNYSVTGKEAFETGFVIVTIIAFQPALIRVEELLEHFLLRGKEDLRDMFKSLGKDLMNTANLDELEGVLKSGLVSIMDVAKVRTSFLSEEDSSEAVPRLLAEIGEPVTTKELLRIKEKAVRKRDPAISAAFSADGGAGSGQGLGLKKLTEDFAVIVPIIKEGSCTGFLGLGVKDYDMRFTNEELSLLSVLANEISVAVENIRLLRESVEKEVLEEELKHARSIQSQLLPAAAPVIKGYDLHAVTYPSRYVGGDYYDFVLLDENTLVISVADVSGKGIPASLLVATIHAAVRSNEDVQARPKEMMHRINRLLYKSTSPEQFATLFYAVVDLSTGSIKYSNAGHDFPLISNGSGSVSLDKSGIVLGCLDAYDYEEHESVIPENGSLVLYTDGVTETVFSGEFFGKSRLEQVISSHSFQSAAGLCEHVFTEVKRFAGQNEAQDDLTLLVLRRQGAGEDLRGA